VCTLNYTTFLIPDLQSPHEWTVYRLTGLLNKHMNLCVLLTLEDEHGLRMFLLFLLVIPLIQVFFFFSALFFSANNSSSGLFGLYLLSAKNTKENLKQVT